MENAQLEELIENLKKAKGEIDIKKIGVVWEQLSLEQQEERLLDFIEIIKEKPDVLKEAIARISPYIKLRKFKELCDSVKKTNMELYLNFINKYLGDVKLDKENNPIIPEDLEKIIFNPSNVTQARLVAERISSIIKNWDMIKQHIQYKRSNSILNDGIEIRTNIEQIVNACATITRVKPRSSAAIEFEMLPDSKKVGLDTQFTHSIGTAVQRAHI